MIWLPLLLLCSCLQARQISDHISASISESFITNEIKQLAADSLLGRETGSAELNKAAGHISSLLGQWGIKTGPGLDSYLQKVPLEKFYPGNFLRINFDSSEITEDVLLLGGVDTTLQGAIIYMGLGEEADYQKKDAKGKIAIVRGGTAENPISSQEVVQAKLKQAVKHGAVAVIELTTFSPSYWRYYSSQLSKPQIRQKSLVEGGQIPYIWLNDVEKIAIARFQTDEGTDAEIIIEGSKTEPIETYNVIGYIEGKNNKFKDEIVVLSAHYDHIGTGLPDATGDSIFNGARDNAVGAVSVLSAAKAMAARAPERSCLFVFFTGEEKGMLGSRYFIESSPVAIDKIVFNLNSDNAGYNDTTLVTVVGLGRTNAESAIKGACEEFGLQAIDDPAPEQNLFDRSDNVHFAKKGIPAPTFSMGFTGFDSTISKYYHKTADNPETLDYQYLLRFFRSYVNAAYRIAAMSEQPFWLSGDKYYNQGLQLYDVPLPPKGK